VQGAYSSPFDYRGCLRGVASSLSGVWALYVLLCKFTGVGARKTELFNLFFIKSESGPSTGMHKGTSILRSSVGTRVRRDKFFVLANCRV
jgi:hypothetical protein